MGSLNWSILGRMGRLGFGYQSITQIEVFQKKNIFGQNWRNCCCFPIFAFFDKFTSVLVF